MRISTRGRYGIRAMTDIAIKMKNGERVVSAKSIAESQSIPENYLEQILSVLKNSGLLTSVRGAGGGYSLVKSPAEITAGEVFRSLEGTLSPAECLDEASPGKAQAVPDKSRAGCVSCENCAAKGVLSRVYNSVTEVVDSITILDIINDLSTSK